MSEEEKAELEELYENSEWWHNRFNAVQRDYENLQQKIDKAIDYANNRQNWLINNIQLKKIGIQNYIKFAGEIIEILGDKK